MSYVNLSFFWPPVFLTIRRDSRFRRLLRDVGLADYLRSEGGSDS